MLWQIIVIGIALATVLEWSETVIRAVKNSNTVTRFSWWISVRVPQGIILAWALHLLGAF